MAPAVQFSTTLGSREYRWTGEIVRVDGAIDEDTRLIYATAEVQDPYGLAVDQDDAVGLRLFDTWEEAALAHHDGVLRLLRLHLADKLKYLRTRHGLPRAALLAWSSIGSVEELAADLVERFRPQAA